MKNPTKKKQQFACRYGCGYTYTDPRPRGKHEHDHHGKVWTERTNGAPPATTYVDATKPIDLMKQALDGLYARQKKVDFDLTILETLQAERTSISKKILILSDALNRMTGEELTAAEAQPAPPKTEAANH